MRSWQKLSKRCQRMRPEETFRFKQFEVLHAGAAMRVGTDAVLLGAWADLTQAKRILDVGTGTGILALMAAQRNHSADIDAVDIQVSEAALALENFKRSPWPNRLHAHASPLQAWQASPYDHIISNPPFFSSGEKAPRITRAMARHTEMLPHPTLLKHASRLLSPQGKFSVIIPATEKNRFTEHAHHHHLFVARQCALQTRHGKPIERFLLELSGYPQVPEVTTLILYHDAGTRSPDYQRLTDDFYL